MLIIVEGRRDLNSTFWKLMNVIPLQNRWLGQSKVAKNLGGEFRSVTLILRPKTKQLGFPTRR